MTNRGMIGHIGLTNEGLFSSTCMDCGCTIYGNDGSCAMCASEKLKDNEKTTCEYCKYENVPLAPIYDGQGPEDKRIHLACPSCGEIFILK